jgi:hypothetical protein
MEGCISQFMDATGGWRSRDRKSCGSTEPRISVLCMRGLRDACRHVACCLLWTCGASWRTHAGRRTIRESKAAPCGLPRMPAIGIAACAAAGRPAATRRACIRS